MRKTLGIFVEKSQVESPAVFNRSVWDRISSGPAVVRPLRCGNYEPLKLVKDVELERVLNQDFYFRNGRKCLGIVHRPIFDSSRFYTVTLLLTLRESDAELSDEVYEWLRDGFSNHVAYMGSPTRQLLEECLELHQMLNSGLVEVKLERALTFRPYFDRLDEVA